MTVSSCQREVFENGWSRITAGLAMENWSKLRFASPAKVQTSFDRAVDLSRLHFFTDILGSIVV